MLVVMLYFVAMFLEVIMMGAVVLLLPPISQQHSLCFWGEVDSYSPLVSHIFNWLLNMQIKS